MYRPQELEPGMVLLMTEGPRRNLLDCLIAWSTANPFVHACLVGEGTLIDPLWRVVEHPLDRYAANGWAFRVPEADAAVRAQAVAWAQARLGRVYGLAELLADGARFDLHWLPLGGRWHPRHWTCSGFVAMAYRAAGLPLTLAPYPAPADLSYSPRLAGPRPWEAGPGPP
ncbi:conserved protein of unknown function [Candidatus Hydrogenisulfobacillus filiaventi]|uniref:Uncharacterized protein n=1 Tax=Candidatus Hydrogenisulfobacillus filiaventi TaxID=2707344 RepID=A0A6F8ZF69_9FIRM|nr:conserved protein of unknown function [Candidatus Hydrogenisulfobacillus filiaventi]